MTRFSDAMNHNLTILELAINANPASARFLASEAVKVRRWIRDRDRAIRELVL